MANQDFFPKNDSEMRDWLASFQANLSTAARQLSLDPVDTGEMGDIVGLFIGDIDTQTQKEQELKASAETKTSHREEKMPILRAHIANIKNRRGYTRAIGELLGIVSRPKPRVDYDTLQPKPKLQTVANEVKINFTRGNTHGANIYCRRGNETSFTLMVRSFSSPYIDARPNLNQATAERREYYLRYMRGNVEVGQNSDIVVVNV